MRKLSFTHNMWHFSAYLVKNLFNKYMRNLSYNKKMRLGLLKEWDQKLQEKATAHFEVKFPVLLQKNTTKKRDLILFLTFTDKFYFWQKLMDCRKIIKKCEYLLHSELIIREYTPISNYNKETWNISLENIRLFLIIIKKLESYSKL